ncbi:hypothetical protein ACQY0O_003243 [Thecaphora frezii]
MLSISRSLSALLASLLVVLPSVHSLPYHNITTAPPTLLPRSTLSDCLAAAQGASTRSNGHSFGVSSPSSSNFASLSSAYNTNFHYNPSYVVLPTSSKDVKAVIACLAAQQGRVKISPKGGGHSYAAYSLGGQDGSVVVDLRHFDTISIDANAKTATVGAGVRLGTLAQKLWDQGFALPHGTCSYVGVSGHSLGGGYGLTTRTWGYLMDRIESMRVVLPSGQLVTVSSSSYPDLFWALRGAGANNFGLVTSFTFRLEAAPSSVVNFTYKYKTHRDCARVLVALQNWVLDANPSTGLPKEVGGEVVYAGTAAGDFDGNACQLVGQHLYATTSAHSALMQRLHNQVAPSKKRAVQFNWHDSLVDIMGSLDASKPSQDHESFYAKSLVVPPSATFTEATALKLIDELNGYANLEGTGNSISFDFLGPLSYPYTTGSQVPSAFRAHKVTFVSQFYSYGLPASNSNGQRDRVYRAFDSLVRNMQSINASAPWKAYVNYVDARLQNWAQMYYGSALDRLKRLKKQYDPQSIFDFPQGLARA